jgi:hypothetical protein
MIEYRPSHVWWIGSLHFIVEPRREETAEVVGPATYDPNQDAIHKRLPALKIVKKEPSKPVPKKALESFINTIF